jgi:hypothetical protein
MFYILYELVNNVIYKMYQYDQYAYPAYYYPYQYYQYYTPQPQIQKAEEAKKDFNPKAYINQMKKHIDQFKAEHKVSAAIEQKPTFKASHKTDVVQLTIGENVCIYVE